jgi:fluoride exporter
VNVVGCAVIAVLASSKDTVSVSLYLFLVPGCLGAFTTFSAFGLETIQLLQNNQTHLALLNIVLNLALGLSAVFFISRLLLPTGGSL